MSFIWLFRKNMTDMFWMQCRAPNLEEDWRDEHEQNQASHLDPVCTHQQLGRPGMNLSPHLYVTERTNLIVCRITP
jgi:hypothetical protein